MQSKPSISLEVVVLISLTLAASLVCAFADHVGTYLGGWLAFIPRLVLHGQVWRLFTSVLVETNPVSLIFTGVLLYWLGADITHLWNSRGRFILFYFSFIALVNTFVCAVTWCLWPEALDIKYFGAWPIKEAIVILWANYFPARKLQVYFIIPLGGKLLICSSVVITLLFTFYMGLSMFLPHIIAEGFILFHIFLAQPNQIWSRLNKKLHLNYRRKRTSRLHLVPMKDDGRDRKKYLN